MKLNKYDLFFQQLEDELYFFSPQEVAEVKENYLEIIDVRMADGEDLDAIIASFDSPRVIAQNYADELGIKVTAGDKFFKQLLQKINKKENELRSKSREWQEKFKNRKQDVKNPSKLPVSFVAQAPKNLLQRFSYSLKIITLFSIKLFIKLFKLFSRIALIGLMFIGAFSYTLFLFCVRFNVYNLQMNIVGFIFFISGMYILYHLNSLLNGER